MIGLRKHWKLFALLATLTTVASLSTVLVAAEEADDAVEAPPTISLVTGVYYDDVTSGWEDELCGEDEFVRTSWPSGDSGDTYHFAHNGLSLAHDSGSRFKDDIVGTKLQGVPLRADVFHVKLTGRCPDDAEGTDSLYTRDVVITGVAVPNLATRIAEADAVQVSLATAEATIDTQATAIASHFTTLQANHSSVESLQADVEILQTEVAELKPPA